MRLRQIRLQTERFHCCGPRFFLPRGRWIEVVVIPIVDPCQRSKRAGKVWIELRCFLKELLSLFCIAAKFIAPIKHLVALHKRQIGFAIFGRSALDLRLLHWRQFRLQFAHNLLGQVRLNGKHIGEIAIVVFRPHVLVRVGINQLHIYADAIADPTNAAFQNGTNPKSLPDFANIGCLPAIRHNGGARDHFQITDLRQISEHVVLNTVREIRVLFFVAQIFKRQHCNRLVALVG